MADPAAPHRPQAPFVALVSTATDPDQKNTIRPRRFPVACWRMDDPGFDFDSSFIVPSAKSQVLLFGQLRQGHPNNPISIFGHADPTGDIEYNKTLSGRRATATYGLFTRRIDLWESLFSEPFGGDRWGARSIETMLRTLVSAVNGQPFLSSQAGGGSATTKATTAFQEEGRTGGRRYRRPSHARQAVRAVHAAPDHE